jgi:hypothetical protein
MVAGGEADLIRYVVQRLPLIATSLQGKLLAMTVDVRATTLQPSNAERACEPP